MTRAESQNGVPEAVPFETTDQIVQAVEASDGGLAAFVSLLKGADGTPGGGSGGSPAHSKTIKRHNWITVILVAILGPGGVYASMQLMSDRSKKNTIEIEHIKEDRARRHEDVRPNIEKNTEDIRLIKVDVSGINKSMESMNSQQSAIAGGIEELKDENVNRIKDELESARRELRRRDRE